MEDQSQTQDANQENSSGESDDQIQDSDSNEGDSSEKSNEEDSDQNLNGDDPDQGWFQNGFLDWLFRNLDF